MIPVRYKPGESGRVIVDMKLQPDHPLVGTPCVACDVSLAPGVTVSLVYIGPGNDPTAQGLEAAGSWHTGAAVAIHKACAG